MKSFSVVTYYNPSNDTFSSYSKFDHSYVSSFGLSDFNKVKKVKAKKKPKKNKSINMVDPFIEELRDEISLEEKEDEKIFTTVSSLNTFILMHGENRLVREKDYINSVSYIDKKSGELKKLDWESKQKASSALHINFMNSFVKAVSDNRTLIFSTATLLPIDRIQEGKDIGDIIHKQHVKFSKYHTQVRSNNANRGMKFLKVYELHKSFDIHSHGSDFVNDDLQSVLNYINSVQLAKDYQSMGRIKLVIDPKYKDDLISILNLSQYDEDNYYQDEKEFKKGSALVFGFFRPTATNKEKIQSMISYVVKYVNKTVYKNGELSLASEFFKYFKIRAFTYSQGVLPSITAYQKIRSALMEHNSKYGDLYELQKDIDSGLVKFTTFYEKKEPEYYEFSRESFGETSHPDYNCPIVRQFISTKDILVNNESYCLVAISVSFSDSSPSITWHREKKVPSFDIS